MQIPLMRPHITDSTKRRVCDVLESGFLTEGPITQKLEQSIIDCLGVAHCLAVTSCTTGLEIALRCLKVGPGQEVIIPNYTYPATATAIAMVGATPVIVDVNPETMLIDYDAINDAVTEKTSTIIPVSLFGNPLDYDRLDVMKTRHGFHILEDAACSLCSRYGERETGTMADISVFSLHPRKFITTGEGGLITTNNKQWAYWMQSYKHFGMEVRDGVTLPEFVRMGTNSKLSNILAAVGLSQMEILSELVEKRAALAARYTELLLDATDVTLPKTTPGGTHSYQSFCIFIPHRDAVMVAMREQGVEVQIGSYHLPSLTAFQGDECRMHGSQGNGRKIFEQCLALPLFHDMTDEQQQTVVSLLLDTIKTIRDSQKGACPC